MLFSLHFAWMGTFACIIKGNNSLNYRIKSEMCERSTSTAIKTNIIRQQKLLLKIL